jgi:hypothetical protein
MVVVYTTYFNSQNDGSIVYRFPMILKIYDDYFNNNINNLIFVMLKCCVFFDERTVFLNSI